MSTMRQGIKTVPNITLGLPFAGDRSMPRTGDIDFAPAAIERSDTARLAAS